MKRLCFKNTLFHQISELSYSHTDDLSDEVFEKSIVALEGLWKQYGYAKTFGELSRQWSIGKALAFFEKMWINNANHKEIHTIGTIYHRGYNGGCERVQAQLMTLWISMGYHVVFFSEEPANPLDFPYPSSVKRILIPKASNLPGRLLALQEGVESEGVDVLVNHDWGSASVVWELMLMKMLNVTYINYIHAHFSWALQSGLYSTYLLRICKMCDVIVAISETNANFFRLCGCNTYLVENPIPEDLKQLKKLASLNSRHVLVVGRISPEKYPMEAIQAFKLVHDVCPDAVLDIVGADSGRFTDRMAQYCSENGISTSVFFHGPKSSDEVNNFFLNAACMLFTSKMEGYPMVLLEAKAYGVPIVMYDLPFLTLVKGKKGILTAQVGDIRGLADNIIRLLQDDKLRHSCGRTAREDFEKHNTYDLRQAWADIFTLCEHKVVLVAPAYYNPADLTPDDNLIIPPLLAAIEKSYDTVLYKSLEYRIGKKLLSIPRKIKRILKGLVRDI